jgi:hypothetical protein
MKDLPQYTRQATCEKEKKMKGDFRISEFKQRLLETEFLCKGRKSMQWKSHLNRGS